MEKEGAGGRKRNVYVMERLNRGAEGRVTDADGAKQTPCGLCQAAMHAIVGVTALALMREKNDMT